MSLLDPTETTVLKLRQHPIVFVIRIIPILFFLIVPPILIFLANISGIVLPLIPAVQVAIILLLSIFYLFMSLFILYSFFLFFLDRWIVTDKHIIDIDQKNLFDRVIAKEELGRVQDITAEVKGVMQTVFNYGNVYIQTAGTLEHFVFENVPAPHFVSDIILRILKDTAKKEV